jgi:hypothetical protein
MKTVIDNIATQAIEWCLIADISDLMSPSYVLQMDEELVRRIAAESPYNQSLRENTQRKLAVLQIGLKTCRAHVDRKISGMSHLYCLS